MATLIMQSYALAVPPKTINDQVKAKGNITTPRVRVEANRTEIANVIKGLRSNNVKTISSESVAKITNAEVLMKFEQILRAPAINEFTSKGGKLDEGKLSNTIDTLAKVSAKMQNQSSPEISDGVDFVQSILLLDLLPAQKLEELGLPPSAITRSKGLLEKEVDDAINPSTLAQAVHGQLLKEGKVSMQYREFLEALKNCLKSLKG